MQSNELLKLEEWPVDRLVPYGRNPRKNDSEVDRMCGAIREFGFRIPVVAKSDGSVVDGHLRLKAAIKLGMTTVPVALADELSDAQVKAFRLLANKSANWAEWDDELLRLEFDELEAMGFDLELTGFDQDEIDALLPEEIPPGLTDENAVPEIPVDPVSKLGDVWLLGKHRLMCGDSTSIDAVEKLMAGQQADVIFTDPPYGMSYGGGRARGDHAKNKRGGVLIKAHGMIIGDDLRGDDLIQMIADSLASAKACAKDGSAFYVCFPWRTYSEFESAMAGIGLEPSACIVWDKKSIGLGNSNYRPQHEFIFYVKGGAWYGDKAQSDVWYMSRGATGEYVHPTQKPVELIERALLNSSKAGDVVHDCFGGSGSTLIAAEKNGRAARLMELDPKYVDVIVKRWQAFTGKQATLESDGTTFDSLVPQ